MKEIRLAKSAGFCFGVSRSVDMAEKLLSEHGSACRLGPIIRRLKKNGIDPGEVLQDGYTGLRCIEFGGPDGVRIRLIEK